MKFNLLRPLFMLVVLPLLLMGTAPASAALTPEDKTSIKEVKKETADLLKTIKSYSADQRDKAIQEVEIAIVRVDQRIDSLQTRIDEEWDDMTRPAREQTRQSLNALQKQRVKMAEAYGRLQSSSSGAWNDIKRGFSKAYNDLNKAWENALKEFGGNENKN